jgi:hypothetical protein
VDRDWALRTILGVGADFQYEVLGKEDWVGRRLVADRFRDRRVFLCGDAAHLWMPMAGYGMNAGIADAMNLSWLLAARLNGWAAEAALAAYEAERQPITEQVSKFAMNHALALQKEREGVPAGIEAPGAEGAAARAAAGRALYDLNVKQYCCGGLNFGSYYDRSPLIAYDGEAPPGYTMDQFTPSTVPGCRTPHVWLDDGRSLYDALGPATRCCVSMRPCPPRRWKTPPRAGACRCACWTCGPPEPAACTATRSCSRGPTSTSPGAATSCPATRWRWSTACAARWRPASPSKAELAAPRRDGRLTAREKHLTC